MLSLPRLQSPINCPQIGLTRSLLSRCPSLCKDWDSYSHQDTNNKDNDHQLNKGKAFLVAEKSHSFHLLVEVLKRLVLIKRKRRLSPYGGIPFSLLKTVFVSYISVADQLTLDNIGIFTIFLN
jgi:hypothetical protein